MDANGEIRIAFLDGMLTLEDDSKSGFKAYHHCGTFRDGVLVSNKIQMDLHIGEGIKDEFYTSLTCTSLIKISFMWKPETTATATSFSSSTVWPRRSQM